MLKLPEGTWIYLDLASKWWKNMFLPGKNHGIHPMDRWQNGQITMVKKPSGEHTKSYGKWP